MNGGESGTGRGGSRGEQPSSDLAGSGADRPQHLRGPALQPVRGAAAARLSGPRHAGRRGRAGRHPLLRLSGGVSHRQHRARHHPLRWRLENQSADATARLGTGGGAGLDRGGAHRPHRRRGGGDASRPFLAGGVADRLDHRLDRRGGGVRVAAPQGDGGSTPHGGDAGSRVRAQRSDRGLSHRSLRRARGGKSRSRGLGYTAAPRVADGRRCGDRNSRRRRTHPNSSTG